MKPNPQITDYMTPAPHTINSGMPIKTAREMMKKYGVRHLPVQLAGHLVGVVTDRDLKLALSFKNMEGLFVDDVMTPDPFAVRPTRAMTEVVKEMAARKYGCAVVQNELGKVIGIFTATDGLRAFGEALESKRKAKPKTAKKRGKK